jgi:hypothetical protein
MRVPDALLSDHATLQLAMTESPSRFWLVNRMASLSDMTLECGSPWR